MNDTYTSIFGGHEALIVPGEQAMTVGPVESHSIFGTQVTAADADIPTELPPASGPVDMTPLPITSTGPGMDTSIPIGDKVTYGTSTFGGPVRDVAGLGAFGAELMLEKTKHGEELVQAAAGFGGYRPSRSGDFGALGASAITTAAIAAAQKSAALQAAIEAKNAADADKKKKMWMYGGIAAAVILIGGAVWYTSKPKTA